MRVRPLRDLVPPMLALLVVAGCHSGAARSGEGGACEIFDDCRGGLACVGRVCRPAVVEGGAGGLDGPDQPPGDAMDGGPGVDAPELIEMACTGPAPPPITCSTRLWPFGSIPYEVSPEAAVLEPEIVAAMDQWSRVSSGRIAFYPRTLEEDYVRFELGDDCDADCPHGNQGGAQRVELSSAACIAHRLGHVIGLGHMHQRFDRDHYLIINRSATECRDQELWPVHLFSEDCADCFGQYSGESVMHAASRGRSCEVKMPTGADDCQLSSRYTLGPIPPRTTPSEGDGGAVIELYSKQYGAWSLSRSLALEVGREELVSMSLSRTTYVRVNGSAAPAATWKDAQHLYLFALGYDGAIWSRVLDVTLAPGAWGDWTSLGGSFGEPAAGTFGGQPYVCARAGTGLWCKSEISPGVWDDPWWPVAGVSCVGQPGMASRGGARMALSCVGEDRKLWLSELAGGFQTWRSVPLSDEMLGPTFQTGLAFGPDGELHAIVKEPGDTAMAWHSLVTVPTPWVAVYGPSNVRPAIVSSGAEVQMFGSAPVSPLRPPSFVQYSYSEGGFHPPAMLGGPVRGNFGGGVGATVRESDDRIDVFTVGSDENIWHRWRN